MNLRKMLNWLRGFRSRYEGAVYSPRRSHIPASLTSARFDVTAHSRAEIARKVRYFERNNPLVQALCGKFENFVVGANPQLNPTSSDAEWNRKAKAWWDEWCQIPDISSRQSFGTLLNLIARSWFVDGDVFIILTAGQANNGRTYPRIQLVEGHLCQTPPEFAQDPMVIDGVRVDERGRPVAYYFAEEKTSGTFTFGAPRPADSVIHVFEPSRAGQVRGMSFFHSVINELHDLDDLHILEMQAARENAATSLWIKTKTGELDPARLRRSRFTDNIETNAGTASTDNKVAYYQNVTGGMARVLQHGDEIDQNPGKRPSVTTTEYWKLKRELVCAGVEIPYAIVFPDSMQGTVYRATLDMATAFFRSRHSVIADVQRRIWGYVMSFAVATERTLAGPPADWRSVSILPPRAPNVDVGRNAAAEQAALTDGRTNYDLIYGPLGLSWTAELRKLNEQLEFIERECPALARHMGATRPQPQQPVDEEDDDTGVPIRTQPTPTP